MTTFILSHIVRRLAVAALTGALIVTAAPAFAGTRAPGNPKLDTLLRERAGQLTGHTRVIVQFKGEPDVRAITMQGARAGRRLSLLRAHVAEVSNARLAALAADPRVARVSLDRPAFATMERTSSAIGAAIAREELGLTGQGIGVAVIDSGVTGWSDDLYSEAGPGYAVYVPRVTHFKDFLNPVDPSCTWCTDNAYDDYGHGTHVAGIIAGNGYHSNGNRSGVAPKASVIGLKVLDAQGLGYVSDVIAALDYAVAVKDVYNIRIINLSAGSGVYESYETDPLAQAAKRAVDAGIVVVAAAGNLGRNADGQIQYGAVTSPGNAPWVLTVGAASHGGTTERGDDTVADFSSRGPTWIDFAAKPDIVAPGVGLESIAEPYSTLYAKFSNYLLPSVVSWSYNSAYLSLSGTSMSTPVVSGTVALMLEANPRLTPNAVKAILQYTAQAHAGYDFLSQGAGFVNARGAIRMARFFAQPTAGTGAMQDVLGSETIAWSKHFIWGNHRVGGGVILPGSNAWTVGQQWGARTTAAGRDIVWGVESESLDNIVWSSLADDNIVWSSSTADNIVWSSDDNIVWSSDGDDNIVWSSDDLDNIVWSSSTADNIVWSSDDSDNIVWGMDCSGNNCTDVPWGKPGGPDATWGTAAAAANIVWSSVFDNIVWSSALDNIVWSSMLDNIVWSASTIEPVLWGPPAPPAPVVP